MAAPSPHLDTLTVVVNRVADIKAEQSTTALALRASQAGLQVRLTDVTSLRVDVDGTPLARTWAAPSTAPDAGTWMTQARASQPTVAPLAGRVLVRTNPGRDPGRAAVHDAASGILALARDQGAVVKNDPDGMRRANSKLYLARFPAWTRPETFVSADPDALAEWVRGRDEPSVLKPLAGTQGTDVFRVTPQGDGNLRQICQVVCRTGYGVAQAFVKQAHEGDVRLILLDGVLLEVEGQPAAVRRVPGAGEFRSNVAQGGHAVPGEVRPHWRRIVDAVGPQLRADGLWLVGLDIVGDVIVEANVAAPGGFVDAEAFCGVDFTGAVLRSLLDQ
ncbi:MAG: hypothetical protein H6742_13140 [Alphaproteobacteria bacterium]|nr:hypothetical protein [Alphaproteobacteria bacterium]